MTWPVEICIRAVSPRYIEIFKLYKKIVEGGRRSVFDAVLIVRTKKKVSKNLFIESIRNAVYRINLKRVLKKYSELYSAKQFK